MGAGSSRTGCGGPVRLRCRALGRWGLMGLVLGGACFAMGALPERVRADGLDPRLSQLYLEGEACGPAYGGGACPDNRRFRQLLSQYGAALAAPIASPARTTGYGGFAVTAHTTLTGIQGGRDFWRRGVAAGREGGSVGSTLRWTRAELRKGLPFGVEVSGTLGRGAGTSLWSFGGALKVALLEGFRHGVLGHLPDVAVRVAMESLVGAPELRLRVPSVDWTLSKPFTVAGVLRLTPLLGAQVYRIQAESGEMQFGEAVGGGRSIASFEPFQATRWRAFAGLQLRYGLWLLHATLHADLLRPQPVTQASRERLPRQLSFLAGGGLQF